MHHERTCPAEKRISLLTAMIRSRHFRPLACAIWAVVGVVTPSTAQVPGNRLSAANHTMVLDHEGHLTGSGKNFYSQLGIGDRFDRAMFVSHPDQAVWSDVWCGLNQTVALKPDGSLWTNNQVGIPETSFTRIGSENTWAKVAMGYSPNRGLEIKRYAMGLGHWSARDHWNSPIRHLGNSHAGWDGYGLANHRDGR